MLRYFYIISFLVYIELSFCYEFIGEKGSDHPGYANKNAKLKHKRQRAALRRTRRQEGNVEERDYKEYMAQVDLANFMQPDPEYESIDENALYDENKRGFGTYESLKDFQLPQQNSNDDHGKDSSNLEVAFGMYGSKTKGIDIASPDNSNVDKTGYTNSLHNPVKKCSDKRMKFPFFSRKKTGTQKFKKNKKRKLFNFHSSSNDEPSTSIPKVNDVNSILKMPNNRLSKRSNLASICPLCKKRFSPKKTKKLEGRQKRIPPRIIHNSRQFYQENSELSKVKQKKDTANYLPVKNDSLYGKEDRIKRDDDNRERQIKELEEVQRKIDNVRITTPKFPDHNANAQSEGTYRLF